MLFNSLQFLVFLPIVFGVFWAVGHRAQNRFLLLASYVFYGWWDYRFLALIILSSAVDYVAGRQIRRSAHPKRWLALSLTTNLGLLGFFKYFNFFIDSAATALTSIGMQANLPTLQIILPVGISFYTFQTLSYTIDVYRKDLEPVDDVWGFFAFVAFFPQLVAGPIERASALLPQFERERTFDPQEAADGLRQMLWGFVKKLVVADTLAGHVNLIYSSPESAGLPIVVATVFFAFQIYCDFSGYSDIAIGCSKLFGFRLMTNFRYPYFAENIADFWRRWHISLSTWFRDYVYIPLGGNRDGTWSRVRNVMITFLVSGLWHGANWTFAVWGGIHGLMFLPSIFIPKTRFSSFRAVRILKALGTFSVVSLAWVFFRAASVTDAISLLGRIFDAPFSIRDLFTFGTTPLLLIGAMVVVEWFQRDKPHGLAIAELPRPARWLSYYGCFAAIILFGTISNEPFIYFQF